MSKSIKVDKFKILTWKFWNEEANDDDDYYLTGYKRGKKTCINWFESMSNDDEFFSPNNKHGQIELVEN